MAAINLPLDKGYVHIRREEVPSSEEIALMEEQRKAGNVAGILFSAATMALFVKAAPITVASVVTYSVVTSVAESQVRAPLGRALHSLKAGVFPASSNKK